MPTGRFSILPVNAIVEQYNNGVTASAIAKNLNVCKSTVCRLLKRNNVHCKLGLPKLFDHDAACTLYKQGYEQSEIAQLFNVSNSAISNLIQRRNLSKDKTDIRKKYFPNVECFKTITTEEDAYWLGFMYTDGNVYKNQITLKLHAKDEHILESFCNYLHVPTSIIKTKKNGLKFIQLQSKHIANNLIAQGCTERKTFTLQPPNIAHHLAPAFLKGAIDGDGGVYFKEKIQKGKYSYLVLTLHFCSASFHFIQWVKDQWNEISITNNTISKIANVYTLQVSGRKAYTILQRIYATNSPYLHRKYAQFINAQSYYLAA